MSPMVVSLIVFACLCVGIWMGGFFRRVLPDPHLRDESRDAIRIGTGLIATLTALVLGLLVASTKSDFDAARTGLVNASVKIVSLDRVLTQYGPQAAEIRSQLRNGLATAIERYWPERGIRPAGNAPATGATIEAVGGMLLKLSPPDESHRYLQASALQLCGDIAQSRLLVLEQAHGNLPTPFLVVLVFWLTILFASFNLFAPRNVTVTVVFVLCALSAATAIFLMLEMANPAEGMMKVSADPLVRAYTILGR